MKLISPFNDINVLADDLKKASLWTATWNISLNGNNCLHLHLATGPIRTPIMPESDRILPNLPQVPKAADRGSINNIVFKSSAKVTKVVSKAQFVLPCLIGHLLV